MEHTQIETKIFMDDSDDEIETEITIKNAESIIVDLSAPEKTRFAALELYATTENGQEIINKLCSMYELGGLRSMRNYLYNICEKTNISVFFKSLVASTLCSVNDKDELGFKAISTLYPQMGIDVPTPYKLEMVKLLMKHPDFEEIATKYFIQIIEDMTLSSEYRYRTALSGIKPYFILQGCRAFVKNSKNNIRHRIMAGQYILNIEQDLEVENTFLEIAEDEKMEYNVRADATDVILKSGSQEGKTKARTIIMKLGKTKGNSIYSNAQNVHISEIEQSVEKALEFLQTFDIMKNGEQPINIGYVEAKLKSFVHKFNKASTESKIVFNEERVSVALNRISMDRALYSKFFCTLEKILLKIWTYISGHKSKVEMKRRLIQELDDMCDTCSSGFASRLINVMSGFGDFEMRISWRDQIIANVSGRLNAKARNMDNLHIRDRVLEEMTLETGDFYNRRHFLKFLRQNMSELREELYEEFKPHISDTDFDLYFRNAIQYYESGSYI